jgi:hypothetical protein
MSDNTSGVGLNVYRADTKPVGVGHLCRVRNGAIVRGHVVTLDIGAADVGTSETLGLLDIGTDGSGAVADSGHMSTVLPAAAVTVGAIVGVALELAADNATAHIEFGVRDVGTIVTALVLVDATATKGAALVVTASAGYGCFSSVAATVGPVYAILLEAATADDTFGPAATVNRKKVLLKGVGGYGTRYAS